MNKDNLELCLFSPEHSKRELLDISVIATEEEEVAIEFEIAVEKPLE
jgi:hypothetical protein